MNKVLQAELQTQEKIHWPTALFPVSRCLSAALFRSYGLGIKLVFSNGDSRTSIWISDMIAVPMQILILKNKCNLNYTICIEINNSEYSGRNVLFLAQPRNSPNLIFSRFFTAFQASAGPHTTIKEHVIWILSKVRFSSILLQNMS